MNPRSNPFTIIQTRQPHTMQVQYPPSFSLYYPSPRHPCLPPPAPLSRTPLGFLTKKAKKQVMFNKIKWLYGKRSTFFNFVFWRSNLNLLLVWPWGVNLIPPFSFFYITQKALV